MIPTRYVSVFAYLYVFEINLIEVIDHLQHLLLIFQYRTSGGGQMVERGISTQHVTQRADRRCLQPNEFVY